MSAITLREELVVPDAPEAGRRKLYIRGDKICFMGPDEVEHIIVSGDEAVAAHLLAQNAHPEYLTELEARSILADINHVHETGNLVVVSKTPGKNEFSSLAAAITYVNSKTPSTTNRFVIRVLPGEYLEDPGLTIPGYVYVSGLDPWNSAVIKTTDPTQDFMTVSPNAGFFNIAVSGPTTPGKSAIKQVGSGTIKLYWVNIKEGYYGVTLAPTTGVARCHCIGVVTDGANMNRMFNIDNPVGVGVFILMQSGPMVTTWTGPQPSAVYLNGNGSTAPYKANATLDLCQFRGAGYDSVYVDNAGLVRGICCSFAGGNTAIHVGPNGASKADVHGSQIKPGGYTTDIWCESALGIVSYSGVCTETKLNINPSAEFVASFADSAPETAGQVIYGELWIGNTQVKTPLASYVQADKNTGLVSGGSLSRGPGAREVVVAAGYGFVDTPNGLKKVTWNQTTLTCAANQDLINIYIDPNGAVQMAAFDVNKEVNIKLGEAGTDAANVVYLFDHSVKLPQFRPRLYDYLSHVMGPINVSGGMVTPNGLKFDISSSQYFVTEEKNTTPDIVQATFTYWRRSGTGSWIATQGRTQLDPNNYDNGTGVLAAVPAGKWKRDLIYVSQNNAGGTTDVHVIYGQELFNSQPEAVRNPIAPDVMTTHACRIAAAVMAQAAVTFTAIDQRPRLGQMAPTTTGIVNHNDLAGRDSDNAHPQYQLKSDLGVPGGCATLDTDGMLTPGQVRPQAHGDQAGGSLHAVATTSANGFMASTDKQKLDGIASGATANSSDAQLLSRQNHTGTQAISTVSGLQAALDAKSDLAAFARLAADFAVVTNNLVDVTGMSFNLEANTTYKFKFDLVFQTAATGTGIALSLNATVTPTMFAYQKNIPTSLTAITQQAARASNTLQPTTGIDAANADTYAMVEGVITTGATPGALQLRFASEVNGSQARLKAGSFGKLEKA